MPSSLSLFEIEITPSLVPAFVGLNTTVNVALLPGAIVDEDAEAEKSPEFV